MNKFEVLKKYFGYDSFREGQETLIDAILNGRDVLGIMPAGAGKSICYQVPALLLPGITLVVSPLISWMKNQVQSLKQAGIHAAYINSSLNESQISKALHLALLGQYKMIYVAPEYLKTYELRMFAKQAEISMLTVEEAHCVSRWGGDFCPGYLKIVQFSKYLKKRPILSAFTDTAAEHVKEDIICVLGLEYPKILVTGFDRKNLCFVAEHPKKEEKLNSRGQELLERLRELRTKIAREERVPPYLIFSEQTLMDMCIRVPLEKEELLEVPGVGEHKFQKYGVCFLKVIWAYTGGVRERFCIGKAESLPGLQRNRNRKR